MNKNCLQCNKEFTKPITRSIFDWNKRAKYCSKECKYKNWKIGGWNKNTKGVMKSNNTSFKKGFIPWNRGKTGIMPVPWNKNKKGTPMARRENSPHWRGGKQGEHKLIRNSLEYKLWRTAVFTRDNFTCVECKIRSGELHADHIMPFAVFPELRFAIDNGRTLCVTCHRKTSTWGMNGKGKIQLKKTGTFV